MHIQTDAQNGRFGPDGGGDNLALDRFGLEEYLLFRGVCFPFIRCLGRGSHNLWLGNPSGGSQSTLSENRHRGHFQRQPYCPGGKTRIDFMKINTVQKIETFKIGSLVPILSPVVFMLLFYSLRWAGVFAAVLFTAMVCSSPARFRTRGGSLVPAVCLAAFVWLCAAVTFVFSFHGTH